MQKVPLSNYSHFLIRHETSDSPVNIDEHYHNSHEILVVLRGSVEFWINGRTYHVPENAIVLINHLEKHHGRVIRFPYERYYMLISQEFFNTHIRVPILQSLLKQRPDNFRHIIMLEKEPAEILSLVASIHKESAVKADHALSAMGSLLNLFLIKLFRDHQDCFPTGHPQRQFELISRVQNHIDKNYVFDVSLKESANQFHVDMYYLSHLFKQITGFTFKEYLLLQRISKAKQLLLTTSDSVTDICTKSGFNNLNHFIRYFKAKEGMSPLRFRRNCLEEIK